MSAYVGFLCQFKIYLNTGWMLEEWTSRFLVLCHLWSLHSEACRTHQRQYEKQSNTHKHTADHSCRCTSHPTRKGKHTYIRRATARAKNRASSHAHMHTHLNAHSAAHGHRHSHMLRPTAWASTAFHSTFTVEKTALWPRVFPTFGRAAARECHVLLLREWDKRWINAHYLYMWCF